MSDSDLLLEVGYSTAKMEADTRKVLAKAEKAGKETAKAFDEGMAKVSGQQAVKAHAREIDRLKRQYDPLYAASKRYERELIKLNRAQEIGAISSTKYQTELKRLNSELEQGALRTQRQGAAMARGSGSARSYGHIMQNVGWQVGDFATQVGAGTSASIALGQQLPQLLGAFGAFGAVAGAAAAVMIPLTAALYETVTGSVDLEEQMTALTETTDAYAAAAKAAEIPIETLRDKYGELADEIARVNDTQLIVTSTLAAVSLTGAAKGVSQLFGASVTPDTELFSSEYNRSLEVLQDQLGATTGEASTLLALLSNLGENQGPQALLEDVVRITDLLSGVLGEDPQKLREFEHVFQSLFALEKEARKQILAGRSEEERDRSRVMREYMADERRYVGLIKDRGVAEKELADARARGDADRIAAAETVIANIDREIEAVRDSKGRVEEMQRTVEDLQAALSYLGVDESGELREALDSMSTKLQEAEAVGGKLDDVTLKSLEGEFEGVIGAVTRLLQAVGLLKGDLDGLKLPGAADFEVQYVSRSGTPTGKNDAELVRAATRVANQIGIAAKDLLTVMSFETAGTFDPWKAGPTTQHGQHYGLIQWGGPQRERYGVSSSMSITEQVEAAGRYLVDAGVKAGDGLARVYAAVLAGNANKVNASDTHNGGVVSNILSAVNGQQFAGHKARASGLLAAYGGEVRQVTEAIREETQVASERQRELDKEATELKKLIELRQGMSELLQGRVADAEFESSLVGKSVEEQARLRAEYMLTQEAKRRGIDLNEKIAGSEETYGQAIKRTAAALAAQASEQENLRRAQDQTSQSAQFFDQIQSTLQNGLIDAIVSGQSFADVLANVARMLAKAALQAALFGQGPLASLFGQRAGVGLLSGLFGYSEGGYTGDGGKYEPKGVVHGGEYVFSAAAVQRIGVPQLESLHKNLRGYSSGGFVGAAPAAPAHTGQVAASVLTKIVNVLDPALIGDFLATPEGEQLIINTMRRNGEMLHG